MRKKILSIGLVLIFLLSGCLGGQNPPEPTATPPLLPTPTSEAVNLPTATSTSGSPGRSIVRLTRDLQSLQPGFYVTVYHLLTGTLQAISYQGMAYDLARLTPGFTISSNSLFVFNGNTLYNLRRHSDETIETQTGCEVQTVSRMGDVLIGICGEENLVAFQQLSGWMPLFPGESPYFNFLFPVISPDQRNLAFCMHDPPAAAKEQVALYSLDLRNCLRGSTCTPVKVSDQCGTGKIAWSPDANQIAQVVGDHIDRINLLRNERVVLFVSSADQLADQLAWSPDGEWIAFIEYDDKSGIRTSSLKLLPADEGDATDLFKTDDELLLVGWLNIISPFAEGKNYLVLPSEASQWLKTRPSSTATNIRRLVPNERIRVLDEREEVQGQVWWRVLAGSDVGWVMETPNRFQDDWQVDLKVPQFTIGSRIIVTSEGNDVRLREAPSLQATVKRRLQPGVRMTLVDGPALVDNYRWWYVVLDDSNLYGWVVENMRWYAAIEE